MPHDTPGRINYCNVRIGAVFPRKQQKFRLQLQFFSRFCVGINYCNVTPPLKGFSTGVYLFRIYVIISSRMVPCELGLQRSQIRNGKKAGKNRVHAQGVVRQHSVLRRVLRRLARVLGKGSQKGSEKGACYGFYSKKGSEKGSQTRF